MDIEWIRERVGRNEYLWSMHADEERRNDGFEIRDVEAALMTGQILERYPNDLRGPSCLVYGEAGVGPIHIVCGQNQVGYVVIVTVYKPAMPKWKTPTERNLP